MTTIKRPPGRPPGSTSGLRVGSRAWQLSRMAAGDQLFFAVPANRTVTNYMGQIGADIGRAGMRGRLSQSHALLVIPGKHKVADLIVVDYTV